MREKTKIKNIRTTGRNKGKNERKSMPGLCSSHLLFGDPRKLLRVIPVPSGLSNTMYTVVQFS